MHTSEILVLSDNPRLMTAFQGLVEDLSLGDKYKFDFAYSPGNENLMQSGNAHGHARPIRVKDTVEEIISTYQLVFSIHSKQLFPAEMVKNVRCINVHPGLNPHNRGWYPQVFSIINNKPCGATIHLIDEELDHGPVICQRKVNIQSYDTSETAYNKIVTAELELLRKWLPDLLEGNYQTTIVDTGNLNLKKDFNELCHLDLDSKGSLREHLNLLRALTHGSYANAYYLEDGKKVYVKIDFDVDENTEDRI